MKNLPDTEQFSDPFQLRSEGPEDPYDTDGEKTRLPIAGRVKR
jgi:hypothetical protein